MLKDYLKYRNVTMYAVAKNNNISYSNINAIANGIIKPNKISAGLLRELAVSLNISMDELYIACSCYKIIYSEKYHNIGFVSKTDGNYILDYFFDSKHYNKTLCRIDEDSTFYIDCISLWDMEKKLSDIELERLQHELLFKA